MEEDKNIDNLFRQAIEPFQMDPPEHVWNSLDEKLNARQRPGPDKRTRRLWISSIAALFILSAGTFLYFSGSFSSPDSETGKTPSTPVSGTYSSSGTNAATQVAPSASDGISSAAKDQRAEQTTSVQPGTVKEMNPHAADAPGSGVAPGSRHTPVAPTASNQSRHASGSQAVAAMPAKKKSSPGTQVSSGEKETASGNVNNSHEGKRSKGVAGAAVAAVIEPSGNAQASSGNPAIEKSAQESGDENNISKPGAAAAVVAAPDLNSSKSTDGSQTAPAQAETAAGSQPQAESQGEVQSENPVQATTEQEPAAAGNAAVVADTITDYKQDKNSGSWMKRFVNRLSVDLFYSPDLAQRKLSVNDSYTGPGSSEGKTYYNNIEKPEYSYSTGIRFREAISSRWSISTGCFYSTYSQTSDLNNIYVVSDSAFQHDYGSPQPGILHGPGPGHGPGGPGNGPRPRDYTQHYVVHTSCGTIDLQNQPFPHQGPGEHYIPGVGDTLNLNIQSTELIQFISIPLTVRYQVNRQLWEFYGEAGAAINFVYDNSVTVNVDNSYTETNDIVGLKNMNYSMLFSIGALYKIQPHWGLFAEPTLRYSLTPINEYSPMLSYPYFLGLKMGLGYHF